VAGTVLQFLHGFAGQGHEAGDGSADAGTQERGHYFDTLEKGGTFRRRTTEDASRLSIEYLQPLEYADGAYQFVFPMVVGARYIPGQAVGKRADGWAPDTRKVPDASKITPQVAPKGTRAGHDVSVELAIDAGVPLHRLHSSSHEIDVHDRRRGLAGNRNAAL